MKRPQKDKSAATSLFSAVRQVLETADAKIGLNELSNEIVETLMEQQSQSKTAQNLVVEEAVRQEAKATARVAKILEEEFVAQGLTAEQAWAYFMGEIQFSYDRKLKAIS